MLCDIKNISSSPDKGNLIGLIDEWYQISSSQSIVTTPSQFFKFMAGWVAINAIYNLMCSEGKGDRKKVILFSKVDIVRDRHINLIENKCEYISAVKLLKEKGVLNLTTNRPTNIEDINNFTDVLLCVYQVRNNLFHGGKVPSSTRDEEVVQASLVIVNKHLEKLLDLVQ